MMTCRQGIDVFTNRSGIALYQLRKTLNLTQETFAERIGIDAKSISNYENGRTRLTLDTIFRIYQSKVTDRSLEELLQVLVVDVYLNMN